MNKTKAMNWIKALRSGKYNQGSETLLKIKKCDISEYCCLGVLGAISCVPKNTLLSHGLLDEGLGISCGIRTINGTPINKNGISLPVIINDTAFESLSHANDRNVSFKQIAEWIEKNYKLL